MSSCIASIVSCDTSVCRARETAELQHCLQLQLHYKLGNAAQASNLDALQVFGGLKLRAGDRILTSFSEYGSNFLAYLQVHSLVVSSTGVLVHSYLDLPSEVQTLNLASVTTISEICCLRTTPKVFL